MVRRALARQLFEAAKQYPVVTVLGPRQSGKTTLLRMAFPKKPYYSLEDPDVRLAAEADPRGFLGQSPDGAILDEVQRVPDLLSYIQGIVDEGNRPGMFILTGSHQPKLHEARGDAGISQSLAGRTAMLTLWPLSFGELRQYKREWAPFELVVKGGYPRLHEEGIDPRRFFNDYLQTYIERDVGSLMQLRNVSLFQKFLMLLAGRIGHIVNAKSLSDEVGVSHTTIQNWIEVLKASYAVFELPPYFENVRKRVVKSPKIYFTDTGFACFLLGIHDQRQAERDPLRGGLFENLVIVEILKGAINRGIRPEVYFFRDSSGNEVDLIIREGGKLIPVEIKSAATFSPGFLKGIMSFASLPGISVTPGAVLYAGEKSFEVHGTRIFNPLKVEDAWGKLTAEHD